jgi:hypothetical protein
LGTPALFLTKYCNLMVFSYIISNIIIYPMLNQKAELLLVK